MTALEHVDGERMRSHFLDRLDGSYWTLLGFRGLLTPPWIEHLHNDFVLAAHTSSERRRGYRLWARL